MKMQIPKKYILDKTVHYQINNQTIDLKVTATIFGEVISTENLLLQLPKEAQRITLGANYETLIPKIKATSELIKYKLPFIAKERYQEEELMPLYKAIQQKRAALSIRDQGIDLKYVRDPWTRELYELIDKYGHLENDRMAEGLKQFVKLFDKNNNRKYDAFSYLGFIKLDMASPVIRNVILLNPGNGDTLSGLNHLKKFPSEENKAFLHERFRKEKNDYNRWRILEGLSAYKDDATLDLLLQHYQKREKLVQSEGNYLLKTLQNFGDKAIEPFAWKLLISGDQQAGMEAVKMLKKLDIEEEKIVEKLHPLLLDQEKDELIWNVLDCYREIKTIELLPEPEVCVQIIKRLYSKPNVSFNPGYALTNLFARRYNDTVPNQLTNLLDHPEARVRLVTIKQIGPLYFQYKHINFPLTPHMWSALLERTKDDSTEVRREAINVTGRMSALKRELSMVPFYLERGKENQTDPRLLMECIQATSNIHYHCPTFDDCVEPFFLECLEHQNPAVRIKVIHALRFSEKGEIKEKIQSMLQDPAPMVRKAVEDLEKYELRKVY